MNEWKKERMHGWMNEWMNERMNEWKNIVDGWIKDVHKQHSIKIHKLSTCPEPLDTLFCFGLQEGAFDSTEDCEIHEWNTRYSGGNWQSRR